MFKEPTSFGGHINKTWYWLKLLLMRYANIVLCMVTNKAAISTKACITVLLKTLNPTGNISRCILKCSVSSTWSIDLWSMIYILHTFSMVMTRKQSRLFLHVCVDYLLLSHNRCLIKSSVTIRVKVFIVYQKLSYRTSCFAHQKKTKYPSEWQYHNICTKINV